jgi:cytochrome c
MRARGTGPAIGALATILALIGAASAPDANRGRKLFQKRCAGCHALDQLKIGPPLRGIYGRAAAWDTRFTYSDALKRARVTWNESALDRWLTDPESLVPGTDMSFRLDDPAERVDVIKYLHGLPGE